MKKIKIIISFLFISLLFLSLSSCKSDNINYINLINDINSNVMESNVRIVSSFAQSRISEVDSTKTGSGVIIKKLYSNYYILTNNHIIYSEANYKSYKVTDCYLNEYDAFLLTDSNLASYDLAIIVISTKNELKSVSISMELPSVDDLVISIGEQAKKSDIISLGKYIGTTSFTHPTNYNANENNISFEVLKHNSFIESGNSGGMLLNKNLELIGINFASGYSNGTFICGYAIGIDKVKEYFNKIDFSI